MAIGWLYVHDKLLARAGDISARTEYSGKKATYLEYAKYPDKTVEIDGNKYTGFTVYRAENNNISVKYWYNNAITNISFSNLSNGYTTQEIFDNGRYASDASGTMNTLYYDGRGNTNAETGVWFNSYLGDRFSPKTAAFNSNTGIGWSMYIVDVRDADSDAPDHTITLNLTHITSDAGNVTTVKEGQEFSLTFTAEPDYEITSAESNIGTVTIAENKRTFTIAGTCTGDIVITATATYVPTYYTITVDGSNYHADSSNPERLEKGKPWSVTYFADTGYRIMNASSNYVNANIQYSGTPVTSVTISDDNATKDLKVYLTVVETPVTPKYTVTSNLTNVTADSSNVTEVNQGDTFTLNYTVNDGFTLDSYTSNIGTISVDGSRVTVTGTATENIVVTISASVHAVTVPVQATLSDGVVADSNNPTEVETGNTFILKYNLADGYQNISATTTVGVAVINETKTQAVISGQAGSDPIIVAVSAQKIPDVYTLTEELTNVTADESNPSQFAKGSSFSIIYHANDNYRIIDATCNYVNADIVYSGNPRNMVTISDDNVNKDIHVVVTGVYAPTKFYCHITGKFEHATCNYTDGELLVASKPIIITAESGYEFKEQYTLTKSRDDKENETGIFEKNADRTILTYSLEGNTWNLTLDDDYIATEPVSALSGFTNLYKVDNDIMYNLSKKRITQTKIKSGEMIDTGEEQIIDYGDFITALYIIPYQLPDTMIGTSTSIILGTLDTNVKAPILKNYKYIAHLGSITVPLVYNNVYDYINTTCTARVPFFGDVILANEYVIGQTLTFDMTIDIYSGNATLNVTSSFTNSVVYSATKSVAMQVPFIQTQNNTVVNSLSSMYKYVSDKVTVEVVRNVPYYADNTFGKDSMECVTLSDKHGYVEVQNVKLVTTATSEEKDTIARLLKSGVFLPEVTTKRRSRKVTK